MTIRNIRQISIQTARAEVTSINEKARTFEVMFSTGAKVLRSSWYDGQFYEELSMDPAAVRMGRLQSGTAPFLLNHNGYDVVATPGVIESARIEGGKGYATVRMCAEGIDPNADMYFRKVVDKIVRNVSVGYRTFKVEKTEGIDTKIPTLRAIDWEPNEISAVAMGAEQGAGIRSAEQTNEVEIINRSINPKEEDRMDPEQLKAQEEAKRALEAAQARALEEKTEAEVQRRLKVAAEREAGIKHACRSLGTDGEKRAAEFVKNDKLSLQDVRNQVLDELAKRSEDTAIQTQHSGIERGEEDHDKWARGATAGMLSRAGVLPMLATVAASVKDGSMKIPGVRSQFKSFDADDSGGEFRNFSLVDLARESLERRGVKTRGMDTMKMVGLALTHNQQRDIGGVQTGSDFAVLLENVMYKTLLGAYAQASDTWRRFCGTDSVQDFRASNRFRTGSFGVLDSLNEAGEFKNKAIPDGQKMSITTETKGNVIALSRQAIINDDMGALTDTANKFGRMSGLSIEVAVYALLAQNGGLGPNVTIGGVTAPLFDDTAWGNVSTGAALSMAALEADRVKMARQKDISNNEYLDLRPQSLLVPLSLGGEANLINRSKFDPTAASAFERPNIVGGLFRDVIDTPRITGTRRYLFTDPNLAPAVLVAFLNGAQAPFMDQQQGFRVDGTEWKIRLDFKAQGFDPKGAITNAGA